MTKHTVKVKNREIPYELHQLEVSQLKYYMENPRINYLLTTHTGEVTQEIVEQKLLALDTTKDLVRDIEANGGLIEEILVLGNEVIEGNTRLAAYRRLQKKHPADETWNRIPAKVFCEDIAPAELFFILGTLHVNGKNEWSAYEKAAYVHRMVRELNYTPQQVAADLSHYSKTVDAMLAAYEAMQEYFLPSVLGGADDYDTQDALHKYSYFEAFFRQKDLAERGKQTPAFVEEFSQWVRKGVFDRAEKVRDLPKILGHKRAQRTFIELANTEPEAAFAEASEILYEAKPEKIDPFYKALRQFRELLRDTAPGTIKDEIEQTGSAGTSRRHEIQRCLRELEQFCKAIGLEG